MLSEQQKNKLLKIARESITNYIREGRRLDLKIEDSDLNREQGAFVTLRKNFKLRGCIGRVESKQPLYKVVAEMAIQSAVSDPRFSKLTEDELDEITIEISVMANPERVNNIEEIKVGTHGLIIRKEFHSGLLLPQVATDYGWDRKEFLENTCCKAGLPKYAWKDAEIYIFTAEVFSETS